MHTPRLVAGAVSGAVGTYALDVSTYLDMAVRGRPSSSVPGDTAERLLRRAGVTVASGDDDETASRRTGLGALLGYGAGMLGGLGYAALFGRSRLPRWLRGIVLGAGVMALTDGASVATGATDPKTWGVSGWVADVVPHLVYGAITATTFELLAATDDH